MAKHKAGGAPTIPDFGQLPDLSGAICADPDFDPDSWYTEEEELRDIVLALCWECPVWEACLESGLDQEAQTGYIAHGIRGGLTAPQRQGMLNQRKAIAKRNGEEVSDEL